MPQAPVFIRLPPRQFHFIEQHFAELLGAAEIELAPGEAMDLPLHHRHARFEIDRDAAQFVGVHLDAGALHVQQHGNQAAFDLFVQRQRAGEAQPRTQRAPEAERDVGMLGGIGGGAIDRHLREGEAVAAGAGDLVGS